MQQSIYALLKDESSLSIILVCSEADKLVNQLKVESVNVLIITIHEFNNGLIEFIQQLNCNFPKTKILINCFYNTEEIVLKTIKAGAKGFLSRHATKNELIEAIYTLRSGYDYYSSSITQLLLTKYLSKLKSHDYKEQRITIKSLSSRQVEILKLWGEGHSNGDIADKLFISIRTVETHKNHIMQKLNLKTTVDMVKFAIKNNLIEI